ncbi:MAG: DUF1016 family protein [Saprospiraceae bacterium]|jgi:predicted nuclease of restriction endonuclease-like (RecB) superfamily|uniref:PDDEXK nuclease domain-containing protein n=1 Tax=Candidatus Brachybacter algidus TaxID=2982024 RepID=UPI001B784A8B|nr:PDDEXK nuclease domain-containing protein [Candidatus Brachybacter algidus]MBP7306463.1 DUF1016 family protein [Saprospiraceae bacterium]MBK6450861.1 DUF1016 family protein [Candidatus Brachybacter algidus]MBK7604969.1 DUF1016 family protein [Candidatus Brachybacter algidus]MBK8355006.1 DUF1016 family protein [Candidatus Brachybacter algidus]MBK9022640.1 DUF1016 family protein [Candidatus Brachybacter algidus]
MNLKDTAYKQWLTELKTKIRSTQIKAAIAVNTELILFYWELGRMLSEKLSQSSWGDKVLETLSKDLRDEFPEMKGFSVSNLKTCKLFFEYFSSLLVNENEDLKSLISSQLVNQLQIADNQYNEFNYQFTDRLQETFIKDIVAKIPWGHIKVIITKIKKFQDAIFYIQKIKENNWSRDVLTLQIKSNLHNRRGASITNFNKTLPEALSDLAQQTLKDPYIFDFLQLSEGYKEKDIENQLVSHITKFLMELGKGFAFVGKQYHLEIADNDYYIDLLFYHIKLKCYVVIELKNTRFIPEYAGKLNFYLSAIDTLIKQEDDKPTIGILLCRDKNNIEAEFALRDINKPMGVSEFQFTAHLPENLKSSLPTIEEIENEFKNLDQ